MRSSYVLVLSLSKDSAIRVGALGKVRFGKGYYCYVGSASASRGSMTLENRTRRHMRTASGKGNVLKWHIDYLLADPRCRLVSVVKFPASFECGVSKRLEKKALSTVRGFGSGDCTAGCKGHLHFFRNIPSLKSLSDR
jgi:Uri superfamily endonuclease